MRRVAGQGQGALLTLAIPCPDRSGRRVRTAATYTRAAIWDAIKGGWVTLPGGGGCEEGLPDVGRHDPPLILAGATVSDIFYVAGPVLGALHTRTLTSQKERVQHPLGR